MFVSVLPENNIARNPTDAPVFSVERLIYFLTLPIYLIVVQKRELGTVVAPHHGAADRSGDSETKLQQAGTYRGGPDIRHFPTPLVGYKVLCPA